MIKVVGDNGQKDKDNQDRKEGQHTQEKTIDWKMSTLQLMELSKKYDEYQLDDKIREHEEYKKSKIQRNRV